MKILVLVTILALATGCAREQPLPGLIDTVQTGNPNDAVCRVACDKDLLRQALLLADSRGTLVAGLTEAAEDSIIGIKMREALILSNRPKDIPAPPPKSVVHHSSKPPLQAVMLTNANDKLEAIRR